MRNNGLKKVNYTILGASGFIGRSLKLYLNQVGIDCYCPAKGEKEVFTRDLGNVFYCIGLTSDFRNRPFDTIDAHVSFLKDILKQANFNKLIYLSSTRVYSGCQKADELQTLQVTSYQPDDIYNLSKLLGESLALSSGHNCHIVRLSNVLGLDMNPESFIASILQDALVTGVVTLESSLESFKDYVWIDDVISGLIAVAEQGSEQIYNIASGKNISHKEIMDILIDNGVTVHTTSLGSILDFPSINIDRLRRDTDWCPREVIPKLRDMIELMLKTK